MQEDLKVLVEAEKVTKRWSLSAGVPVVWALKYVRQMVRPTPQSAASLGAESMDYEVGNDCLVGSQRDS